MCSSDLEKEVASALEAVRGVKRVIATGEREADSFTFHVESDRGIDARKPIFSLCAQKNWPIIGLMPSGTDLESIFIRLVDRANGEAKQPEKGRRRAH